MNLTFKWSLLLIESDVSKTNVCHRGGYVRILLVYIYGGGPYFEFSFSSLLYICIHTHNKNDLMFTENKINVGLPWWPSS